MYDSLKDKKQQRNKKFNVGKCTKTTTFTFDFPNFFPLIQGRSSELPLKRSDHHVPGFVHPSPPFTLDHPCPGVRCLLLHTPVDVGGSDIDDGRTVSTAPGDEEPGPTEGTSTVIGKDFVI